MQNNALCKQYRMKKDDREFLSLPGYQAG